MPILKSLRSLVLLGAAFLLACESLPSPGPMWQAAAMNRPQPGQAVKISASASETLFFYPDSIIRQSPNESLAWQVTFYLETERGNRVIGTDLSWIAMFGEYIVHCGQPERRELTLVRALGFPYRGGAGNVVFQASGQTPKPLVGPNAQALFDAVCTREEVRKGVESVRQATEERQRIERTRAAEAWRIAQAERDRREKVAAEDRVRRERNDLAERLRQIEMQLKEVESADRKNHLREACQLADQTNDLAQGTSLQDKAASAKKQVCARHEQWVAERLAKMEQDENRRNQDENRRNQNCRGTPRVSREVIESLGRLGNTNPLSITPIRLERVQGSPGCRMTLYYPNGVASCSAVLDDNGIVVSVRHCADR